MIVLRILGQVLIAASLMLLSADAVSSLKAHAIELMSLNEFVGLIGLGDPLGALQAAEDPGEVAKFFGQGAAFLLGLASWVTLGFFGVVLAWAGDIHGRE